MCDSVSLHLQPAGDEVNVSFRLGGAFPPTLSPKSGHKHLPVGITERMTWKAIGHPPTTLSGLKGQI